jgi:hypothetical protein
MPRRRVFISASTDSDLRGVQAMLESVGISVVGWEDLPSAPVADTLRAVISSCDGLVGLAGPGAMPAGVLVEVGAALAFGLPVVL